jgi:hypothetical protein
MQHQYRGTLGAYRKAPHLALWRSRLASGSAGSAEPSIPHGLASIAKMRARPGIGFALRPVTIERRRRAFSDDDAALMMIIVWLNRALPDAHRHAYSFVTRT